MIVKIGHDEAIIKQFPLSKKSRHGPNGVAAILPKGRRFGHYAQWADELRVWLGLSDVT
jgi:hypothetical protein